MSKAIRAASAGKLSKLKQIVKKNELIVNQCNRDGYTVLSTAISSQQYEIIDYLLHDNDISNIIDVNAGNNNVSPIFVALNTNNEDIAVQLIDHGANPNTLCPNNTSIIHYCLQLNLLRLIRKLFKNPSFDYKIISPISNENIFHIIVDTENEKLLSNIINLIDNTGNTQDIKRMMNALNNSGHTPLWKSIQQNQLQMTQIMLDIGYADINCICCDNQTVSHLIHKLYPQKNGPFHQLLHKYNADLTITDNNGHIPADISEIVENDKYEEALLLEETMRMREKLKNSRIENKRKHDKLLNIWLNIHKLNKSSFSNALLIHNIKWNEFMLLNDEEMYEIIQDYCHDMNDVKIQYILNQWNGSKTEYKKNIENKKKQKKIKKKQIAKRKKEEKKAEYKEEKEEKKECNKYVKQFLSDFGLLELEFIFAKEKIDMTQLSEINNIWISKYIVGNSHHANNLKMRLKLAIKELRKEIVKEMKAKIKNDYKQKYGDSLKNKLKNRNNLWRKLKRIHPLLAKLEEILSDPLYLLSFGFVIFIIFTFLLFVIVGPGDTENQSVSR